MVQVYIHIKNCCADLGAPKGTCNGGACGYLLDMYFTLMPRLNFDPAPGIVAPEENPQMSLRQVLQSAVSRGRAIAELSGSWRSNSRMTRVAVMPPPLHGLPSEQEGGLDLEVQGGGQHQT
jgi:hypothetical protein